MPGGIPGTLQHTVHLQYPDAAAIKAAYRELPKTGTIFLTATGEQLAETLQALEASGFYGLQINPQGLAARNVEIRGFKGKQGPCFETGRSASYSGAAVAALDDDNHLLFHDMRVCEKTGGIYSRPPYEDFVTVSEAEPDLLAKLDLEPVPFDCDTLEADAARLRAQVAAAPAAERLPALYCGPFRALILADGTIVRRGQATTVPAAQLPSLRKEHLLPVDTDGLQVQPPEFFAARYDAEGAVCLLGELPLADSFSAEQPLRWQALSDLDPDMRRRLQHLIERQDKQFILTGSDPRIQFGCCPSDDVYHANRLVEAGILACFRAPTPPEACPTTIYACRGEIGAVDGRPQVQIDHNFRQQLAQQLQPTDAEEDRGRGVRWLRYGLLLFILVAVVVGVSTRLQSQRGLPYGFAVGVDEDLVLAFYHPTVRCDECLRTEALIRQTLAAHPDSPYRLVIADYRKHPRLEDALELFTSSIVLWDFEDGQLQRQPKVLEWAWDHRTLADGEAFQARLYRDLQGYSSEASEASETFESSEASEVSASPSDLAGGER